MGKQLLWTNDYPRRASNVIAVGANGMDNRVGYSVALTSAGTVTAWGYNGSNASGPTNVPPGLCNVVAISAGPSRILALKSDGTVVAWGYYDSSTNVPNGLSNVVAVAAGWFHNLAVKNDGTVVAWGSGSATNVPSGLSNVVAIAAGYTCSLALKNDGTVVAWGSGSATSVPADLSNVVAVAAERYSYSGLALKSDGTVVGWSSQGTFVPAAGLSNVVAIAPLFAIKDDGMLVSWGLLNPPAGLSNVVAIAVGFDHCLAITIDLKISSIEQANANPAIRFHTFSGQQYSVEYSPDLSSGNWAGLPGGDVSGNGFDVLVTDTNADAAARFYRLRQE